MGFYGGSTERFTSKMDMAKGGDKGREGGKDREEMLRRGQREKVGGRKGGGCTGERK